MRSITVKERQNRETVGVEHSEMIAVDAIVVYFQSTPLPKLDVAGSILVSRF